jgi:predicted nucleic acid-binding protein
LVDTNRFADLVANNRSARERLQQASELWLSVITVGELLAGLSRGSRQSQNESRLTELLDLQGVNVLLLGRDTPRYYANVWKRCEAKGRKFPRTTFGSPRKLLSTILSSTLAIIISNTFLA